MESRTPIRSSRKRSGLRRWNRRLRRRLGFSLFEVALALGVASGFLVVLTATVAEGLRMQIESDRLTLAMVVAQAKLSQLRNNPNLSPLDEEGEIENAGQYSGYRFHLKVAEEKLDLAKIAEGGGDEANTPAVDDLLEPGVQNNTAEEESLGTSEQTQTGGLVEVLRVIVAIDYPSGDGYNTYHIETLLPKRKTVGADGE